MPRICCTLSKQDIEKCCRSAYWFLNINLKDDRGFAVIICKKCFISNKYNGLHIKQPVAKGVLVSFMGYFVDHYSISILLICLILFSALSNVARCDIT